MSYFLLSQSWPSAITATMILASGAILLLAAGHDIISRTVPNWMSLAVAVFGVVASLADGRLLISCGLGLGVFLGAALLWRRGLMGGADVKLLGAIAIVLPPGMVTTFVIAMSIAGAVHAAAYLLARRVVTPPRRPRPRGLLPRALRAERWRISRGGPLPYACAIAAGFVFVLLQGSTP